MAAREIVELIKKNQGIPWNDRSSRDTFKVGNPDTTVKGIATTMMTTFDMLKRANAAGLNIVITHEDTFWNDRDDTKDLTENPLYKLQDRTRSEERHGHLARLRPNACDDTRLHGGGRASFGGYQGPRACDDAPRHFDDSGDNPGRAAAQVKRSSGARAFRCVGDPQARISKILVGPGYALRA
jgi:NIF3 (NGG1p interacting factor 3)